MTIILGGKPVSRVLCGVLAATRFGALQLGPLLAAPPLRLVGEVRSGRYPQPSAQGAPPEGTLGGAPCTHRLIHYLHN